MKQADTFARIILIISMLYAIAVLHSASHRDAAKDWQQPVDSSAE